MPIGLIISHDHKDDSILNPIDKNAGPSEQIVTNYSFKVRKYPAIRLEEEIKESGQKENSLSQHNNNFEQIREEIKHYNRDKYELILKYEQQINDLTKKHKLAKNVVKDYMRLTSEKNQLYLNSLENEFDNLSARIQSKPA